MGTLGLLLNRSIFIVANRPAPSWLRERIIISEVLMDRAVIVSVQRRDDAHSDIPLALATLLSGETRCLFVVAMTRASPSLIWVAPLLSQKDSTLDVPPRVNGSIFQFATRPARTIIFQHC